MMVWYNNTLQKDSPHEISEHMFLLPSFFEWEHLIPLFTHFNYTRWSRHYYPHYKTEESRTQRSIQFQSSNLDSPTGSLLDVTRFSRNRETIWQAPPTIYDGEPASFQKLWCTTLHWLLITRLSRNCDLAPSDERSSTTILQNIYFFNSSEVSNFII